jgi:hypothetical protein
VGGNEELGAVLGEKDAALGDSLSGKLRTGSGVGEYVARFRVDNASDEERKAILAGTEMWIRLISTGQWFEFTTYFEGRVDATQVHAELRTAWR